METTEKKLPKHLQAAVNQLEKHVGKFELQRLAEECKKQDADNAIKALTSSITALSEQIKKLKGETAVEVLHDISKGLK